METVIILYVLGTGLPEAIYVGEGGLPACLQDALTYEVDVACVPPTSDTYPFFGLELTTSPRPQPRPEGA